MFIWSEILPTFKGFKSEGLEATFAASSINISCLAHSNLSQIWKLRRSLVLCVEVSYWCTVLQYWLITIMCYSADTYCILQAYIR